MFIICDVNAHSHRLCIGILRVPWDRALGIEVSHDVTTEVEEYVESGWTGGCRLLMETFITILRIQNSHL